MFKFLSLLILASLISCTGAQYSQNDSYNNSDMFLTQLKSQSASVKQKSMMSEDAPLSFKSSSYRNEVSSANMAAVSDEPPPQTEFKRIMVYNGRISLHVEENFDTVAKKIKILCESANGYVLSYAKNYTVIRIAPEKLDEFMIKIAGVGEIADKQLSGQDVSNEYYDLKTRLENAEKTRLRYLDILSKAADVPATLAVEKELERVNGLIEQYKGQYERLKHISQFATITIYYSEPQKPGILGWVFVGVYEGVKWLFVWN